MRLLLLCIFLIVNIALSTNCQAWGGFDADTADLVEITPDQIPHVGDAVEVINRERDTRQTCLVQNVTRNKRTIEVVILDPNGKIKILVMESR